MRNARNGIYNGTESGGSGNNTSGNESDGDTTDKDSQIADLENTVSNLEGTIDSRPSYNARYNAGKTLSDVSYLETTVVTNDTTVTTVDIPANTGISYGIDVISSRRNATAAQVTISSVTTSNGTLTKVAEHITSAPVTSSSIWNTSMQAFNLKKTNATSVAKISITTGHTSI